MLAGKARPEDALRDEAGRECYHFQRYECDTVLIKAASPGVYRTVSRERPNWASAVLFSVFCLVQRSGALCTSCGPFSPATFHLTALLPLSHDLAPY